MPAIAVEEVEDPLEGLVGDGDVRVVPLQVVNVEQAAVKERDSAQQRGQVRGPVRLPPAEPLVEKTQQEDAVELLEASVAALALYHAQTVTEVVGVAVQEALLLNEVDEHHAVEHEGGVPVPVTLGGDALDEVSEGGQLSPEAFVEALGYLLDIEGLADEGDNVSNPDAPCLVLESDDETI